MTISKPDLRPSHQPEDATPGALRQRKWAAAHPDRKRARSAAQREYQRTKRAGWAQDTGPKAVRIVYPDCATDDWVSLTEYNRHKGEWGGAQVFIHGKQVEVQEAMI